MVHIDHPEGEAVDLTAVLTAMAEDDIDALRKELGEQWWINYLRIPHYRHPERDTIRHSYGIIQALNHGDIDTLEPLEDGSYKLGRETIAIDGEQWNRITDEEVVEYYAAKADTRGMGFVLPASHVVSGE